MFEIDLLVGKQFTYEVELRDGAPLPAVGPAAAPFDLKVNGVTEGTARALRLIDQPSPVKNRYLVEVVTVL